MPISMCFVLSWNTWLIAIWIACWLSHHISTALDPASSPSSCRRCCRYNTSAVSWVMVRYYASELDRETTICFLLLHDRQISTNGYRIAKCRPFICKTSTPVSIYRSLKMSMSLILHLNFFFQILSWIVQNSKNCLPIWNSWRSHKFTRDTYDKIFGPVITAK